MRTSIIKIGNSHGLRIPKILLEQSRLGTEVELEVEDDRIVIRSASQPRKGWSEQFQAMAENADDKLLDQELALSGWDKDEWEW